MLTQLRSDIIRWTDKLNEALSTVTLNDASDGFDDLEKVRGIATTILSDTPWHEYPDQEAVETAKDALNDFAEEIESLKGEVEELFDAEEDAVLELMEGRMADLETAVKDLRRVR